MKKWTIISRNKYEMARGRSNLQENLLEIVSINAQTVNYTTPRNRVKFFDHYYDK